MEPLRDYRVINHRLLSVLARQAGLSVDEDITVENALNMTIKGFGGSRKVTKKGNRGGNEFQVLREVVDRLRSSGQLRAYRPESGDDFWHSHDIGGWYVAEDMFATPVTMPLGDKFREKFRTQSITVPEVVTVWVSDPIEPGNGPRFFDWRGAFVFLIEDLSDFKPPNSGRNVSGISALRLVVDFLSTGVQDYERNYFSVQACPDEFGHANSSHPIEKLTRAGGYAGRPRQIEAVYKITYVSDEQVARVKDGEIRVYDILAYPLCIAE